MRPPGAMPVMAKKIADMSNRMDIDPRGSGDQYGRFSPPSVYPKNAGLQIFFL